MQGSLPSSICYVISCCGKQWQHKVVHVKNIIGIVASAWQMSKPRRNPGQRQARLHAACTRENTKPSSVPDILCKMHAIQEKLDLRISSNLRVSFIFHPHLYKAHALH